MGAKSRWSHQWPASLAMIQWHVNYWPSKKNGDGLVNVVTVGLWMHHRANVAVLGELWTIHNVRFHRFDLHFWLQVPRLRLYPSGHTINKLVSKTVWLNIMQRYSGPKARAFLNVTSDICGFLPSEKGEEPYAYAMDGVSNHTIFVGKLDSQLQKKWYL